MQENSRLVWIQWLQEYAEDIGAGFKTVQKDGRRVHVVHFNGDVIVSVYEA